MRTTLPQMKSSWSLLAIIACLGLMWTTTPAAAQRPSLGGLQLQINDMLSGDLPFKVVALGDGCRIFVDPEKQAMTFQDPHKFLFDNPLGRPELEIPQGTLLFGDGCRIFLDVQAQAMTFEDPHKFLFNNPLGIPVVEVPGGFMQFGDECTIGIDPRFRGMVEKDPFGLRLLGRDGQGCILTFGPTDLCRILVDPERQIGLILEDPFGFNFENPAGGGEAQVNVDGTVFANAFVERSSRELKENVRTIDNALETVKKLRGVYFDWKDGDGPANSELGFIAEEVGEVLSEATVYSEDGAQAEGVKYANLVAVVVEGVKAQQKQIEAQQKLIEQLQEEVAELRGE